MAFPTVNHADTTTALQTSNATTWSVNYPANIVANDLLIAFFARDGAASTGTWPAGWITSVNDDGGNVTALVAKKKAVGTEAGSFSVTGLSSEQGTMRVIRISASSWEGTIGTAFDNSANAGAVCRTTTGGTASLNPNPSSLDPNNWVTEDTLWIAFSASDHGDTTYTGFPSGYGNTATQESGGAGGAGSGIAYLNSAVSSEDPGTFTVDASEQWCTYTIAVRPVAAVATFGFPFRPRYQRFRITR